MRAVNLLPADSPHASAGVGGSPLLLAVPPVAVVAVLALLTFSAGADVSEKRAELESAQEELAALPPAPRDASAALAEEASARMTALGGALSRRVAWDRILRKVASVLPANASLTNVTGTSPVAAVAAGSTEAGLTLTGRTSSHAEVARVLTRLAVVPELANVRLGSSAITDIGPADVVEFTVIADVRPPGGAS